MEITDKISCHHDFSLIKKSHFDESAPLRFLSFSRASSVYLAAARCHACETPPPLQREIQNENVVELTAAAQVVQNDITQETNNIENIMQNEQQHLLHRQDVSRRVLQRDIFAMKHNKMKQLGNSVYGTASNTSDP